HTYPTPDGVLVAIDSLFFQSPRDHRQLHSFPTRRSSDLPAGTLKTVADGAAASATSVPWFENTTNAIATTAWSRARKLSLRGRRSEEHTSELQSPYDLVCRLLLEKKKYENRLRDAVWRLD